MINTTKETVVVELDGNIKKLNAKLKQSESSTKSTASAIKAIFATIFTGAAIKAAASYSDQWANISSRIKLVSSDSKEYNSLQKELIDLSYRTRTELTSNIELFAKIKNGTQALNYENKDLIKVTEAISQSMIISGVSTQSANSAILQLSQGIASGVLRGEELNSVMENSQRLAKAIADGMNIEIGMLRKLGSEGKITSEMLMKALLSQSSTLSKEFGSMDMTISQSLTRTKNITLETVGKISKAFGAGDGATSFVNQMNEALKNSTTEILTFGAFSASVLKRTSLLFLAVGSTIKDAVVGNIGGTEETNEIWRRFFGYDIIEEAKGKLDSYSKKLNDVKLLQDGEKKQLVNTKDIEMLDTLIKKLDPISVAYKEMMTDIDMLNALKERGSVSIEQYNNLLEKTSSKYASLFDEIDTGSKQSNQLLLMINSTLTSGITSGFRSAMDGARNFGDMFQTILKDIVAQMIEVMVVQKAINSIMGISTTDTGVKSVGAIQGPVRVDGYMADGGVTKKAGSFLVGENGPEIVSLPKSANVTPNSEIGSKSTVNVNVINNTNSNVSVEESGDTISVYIDAISDAIERGTGSIGRAIETRYGLTKA